jgi:hypothetical protein
VTAQPDKERVARNEGLFRLLNDGRELEARDHGADGFVAFTCECGLLTCHQPLRLTVAEYEDVRCEARHFAVVPGHEIPETEDVVARTDRYFVVRKRDETAPIVEASNPPWREG